MSGDNLGSQEIGGFKIGPAANLKCRECLGLSADLSTKVMIINTVLWTLHFQTAIIYLSVGDVRIAACSCRYCLASTSRSKGLQTEHLQ